MSATIDGFTGSLQPAIPVPTHGSGGSFSVKVSGRIRAPPSVVFATLRDTSTWSKWNSFAPRITISSSCSPILELGSVAKMAIYMTGKHTDSSRDQEIVITVLDEMVDDGKGRGYRIAWKAMGFANWQMKSERVLEFRQTSNGETEYVTWETTGGALGKLAKSSAGSQLVDRFTEQARDLKVFVEAGMA